MGIDDPTQTPPPLVFLPRPKRCREPAQWKKYALLAIIVFTLGFSAACVYFWWKLPTADDMMNTIRDHGGK